MRVHYFDRQRRLAQHLLSDTHYLEPTGFVPAHLAPDTPRLGPFAFTSVLRRSRDKPAALIPPGDLDLTALTSPRAPIAGLTLDRPRIMGIVNVTPDSFSDGGDRFDPDAAIAAGMAMAAAGADILDIGGESTRPGAAPVSIAEECRRVLPVVQALADAGHRVSIDSRNAAVIEAALAAGAAIVNDVTALSGDPGSLAVAAAGGVPVVLMHMLGDPRTMQQDPRYDDVLLDIWDYLAERIAACEAAGIPRARLVVDPGIGFGKTVRHNLDLIRHCALFHSLGCAVLVGASRKSFIARLSRGEAAKERVPGSVAVALAALDRGVQLVRVHDVAETAQAVAVWRAISLPPDAA